MGSVQFKVETITPASARVYLEKNVGNRPLSQSTVELYADQMRRNLWKVNNDAICFNANGRLINGQHRLHAVIASGKSQDFLVARNMADDAFVTMDNGKNRIASDILYFYNVANQGVVASIVKRKMLFESRNVSVLNDKAGKKGGGNASRIKISNAMILDEYYNHDKQYDKYADIARRMYYNSHLLSAAEYGGVICYLILVAHHPEETVISFFEEFTDKKPTTNNAVMLFRRKLSQDAISRAKLLSSVKQKLLIKTWNAYVTGKEVKSLIYNETTDKDIWFI